MLSGGEIFVDFIHYLWSVQGNIIIGQHFIYYWTCLQL